MIDLRAAPNQPGCYLYKDESGKVIYVGKAKNLSNRVKSYFQSRQADEKTASLVREVFDVEYFVTSNEVEALILENNLIKKHWPKYNVLLKDSRRYAYLQLTGEEYPRLLTVRDKSVEGELFGPFTSGEYRELLRKLLVNNFKLRTCNKLPKKACLRHHINLCDAPCVNKGINYGENVEIVRGFLKGKSQELVKELGEKMREHSKNNEFEQAKKYRDNIRALEFLQVKQKFEVDKKYDENIINYSVENGKVYLIVFSASRGVLSGKQEFSFNYYPGFLDDFVKQYYSENPAPNIILIPHDLEDKTISDYLSYLKGSLVKIKKPVRGSKKELLELVLKNVEASFLKQDRMVKDLREKLELNFDPVIIEGFDVSHLQGTNSVASMVQFVNGKPNKSGYRRFKLKSYFGVDDFLGIYEAVKRRYSRLKSEGKELPDLILIDGGKGQLSMALKALKKLELSIPVVSLAKQFEEVFVPGRASALKISPDSEGVKLLIQVRNESHRFAINYHKLLRGKRLVEDE